jgi:isopenicillin N synthase-like dioxygenase
MITYTPPAPALSLPIVDLSDSYSDDIEIRKQVAWEIHKACRDTGFFYVTGHRVPEQLRQSQLMAAQRFFELPLESKTAISMKQSAAKRGYETMQAQTLDTGSPADLKEGFQMGIELPPTHPRVLDGVPNHGPNQWPEGLPGFRRQMEMYQAEMIRLGRHLMQCLALSLYMPENYFDAGTENPMCTVRLLHYPPHPTGAEENQLGAGAHTDWGAITMLLQDDCGGLELRNSAGEWIRADPVKGAFVVNLGDMVRRWSNDLYQSTMHRVLNNVSGRDRYSVASFFNPDHFYRVECLATCLPAGDTPRYQPVTVGEHIEDMFQRTYR